MDKIAIISDIHGNIPALEAVFDDIDNREIKRIICLGDVAGKGPSSAAAVDSIKERCECTVRGNWDQAIAEWRPEMTRWQQLAEMIDWHQKQLGEDRLAFLSALPVYLEFYMSGKLVRLCHASPHDIFHRTFLTTDKPERLRLFEPTQTLDKPSDVLGYGDIHWAYIDNVEHKIIFNTGSVGNPLDMPESSYAILEGEYGSEVLSPLTLSLVRVPYDIQEAVRQAIDADMPETDAYITEITKAIYSRKGVKK